MKFFMENFIITLNYLTNYSDKPEQITKTKWNLNSLTFLHFNSKMKQFSLSNILYQLFLSQAKMGHLQIYHSQVKVNQINLGIFKKLNKITNSVRNILGAHKQSSAEDGKPWFCHDLDCPAFKTIEKIYVGDNNETEIEKRCYGETEWVRTGSSGKKSGTSKTLIAF